MNTKQEIGQEKENHSNYLELMTVYLACKSFNHIIKGNQTKVMIDNQTAVSCINYMGTSHSDKLNTLTRTIWEWCIANDIFLIAAHIPGVENKSADFESRINRKETEWKLNTQFLHGSLSKLNFTPEIDIFASRVQTIFKICIRCDPGAIAINAFTLD